MRAYESRNDILQAVIIGAEGTPYHDGLFFFDVQFPLCSSLSYNFKPVRPDLFFCFLLILSTYDDYLQKIVTFFFN